MELRVILLSVMVGVAWCGSPPLSMLPKSLAEKEEEILGHPTNFAFNFGLSGAVTQEDWDRATVENAEPPVIVHPDLNGSPEPVTITGKIMRTIKEREIYSFQGIRFGEPATGKLRFKRTTPAAPYFAENNFTLDATHLGEKCPQKAMFGYVGAGDEDCLNLNVYSPYLPDGLPGAKLLPVMMFIHGGAFISGDSSLYLPTKLLDHDVILVVIHYRLGSLGFFSLQNDTAPGNAGLWDQIEALQWIQDNIEGFGGDKDRVTIFGESAGSASVNYMLILPEAAGLFHGVIGESGSALEQWSLDPEPLVSAGLIAGRNGCENDTVENMFDCMSMKPHEVLSLSMASFVSEDRQRGQMGFRGAAPVVESEEVTNPLIIKDPPLYYEDGDANDVPLLIGANKHEGSFVLGIMYTAYLDPHGYVNDSYYIKNGMLPDLLNAFGFNDKTNGIAESLEDGYMGGVDMTDFMEASPGLIDLAGVLFLKSGAWTTAKMHAKYTTSDTFVYSFDFESDDSMFRWLFIGHNEIPFKPGVTHADELMYLFSFPAVLEDYQLVVKDRMVRLWTNFAIHGDPTPDSDKESWDSLNIPKWPILTDNVHPYMLIQDECSVEIEYPDRWHIALEESREISSTTTVSSESTTTVSSGSTTKEPYPEDYDHVVQQREAFMISMIIFIITTVAFAAGCGFFFFKSR